MKFDFTNHHDPGFVGECSGKLSCTSEHVHQTRCPKLLKDLVRFKADRDNYYEGKKL